MLRFVVPVLLSLATSSKAYRDISHQSAASEAQIRFAIENKYDDTGPGAKEPQYAYHTYTNLDDALIAYLDDPDTKLPKYDRHRAIQKLTQSTPNYGQSHGQGEEIQSHGQREEIQRYHPKTVEDYTGYKPPKPKQQLMLTKLSWPKKYEVPYPFQGSINQKEVAPYRLQRIQPVKGNPLSLAHYSRDSGVQSARDQFNPHPKYTFSYGVNGPDTGDHKSAHEEREGGAVRGYYSFLDADGAQRTVHYTADDKHGFQATVERSPHQ